MNEKGFIKLDRKMMSWRWYKDANTMRVFLHLLFTANIRDNDYQNITIHRGELATSYNSIAEYLGLSVQSIRTAINHLKSTGEITSKQYPKFQVISIVNYNSYQAVSTSKITGNQQATNRQVTGNQQQSKKNNTTYYLKNGRSKEGADAQTSLSGEKDKQPEWMKRGFESEADYIQYLCE